MEYLIRTTKTNLDFSQNVKDVKVPLLVLDQKWHQLFAGDKKPKDVQAAEKKLTELLAFQGRVQQEIKELKKAKSSLMQSVMENMDGAEGSNSVQEKKLAENRRLINEINEKIRAQEDMLLELPVRLREANDLLLSATLSYCYIKLRVNTSDIETIDQWIRDVRVELKKQIIRKQNAEIRNKAIYAYMHDIFGPQMLDVFDLTYQPEEETEQEAKDKKDLEEAE